MSYQRKLETLEMAESNPIYDEKEFDITQIGAAVYEIIQRFNINWPGDVLVPSDEADSIVKLLVKKYAEIHKKVERGKSFTECYELETLMPAPEWQEVYEDACHQMERDYGLRVS